MIVPGLPRIHLAVDQQTGLGDRDPWRRERHRNGNVRVVGNHLGLLARQRNGSGARPAYRLSRPFLRHHSTPTIGDPISTARLAAPPTPAMTFSDVLSFEPSGSRCGLLSAIKSRLDLDSDADPLSLGEIGLAEHRLAIDDVGFAGCSALSRPVETAHVLRPLRDARGDLDRLDRRGPVEAGRIPEELVVAAEAAHRTSQVVADHIRRGRIGDRPVRITDPQPQLFLPAALAESVRGEPVGAPSGLVTLMCSTL
jgi:hypothetical protein